MDVRRTRKEDHFCVVRRNSMHWVILVVSVRGLNDRARSANIVYDG